MLANPVLCALSGNTDTELALNAYENAPSDDKKTNFALRYALEITDWIVPHYLIEGLQWLAQHPNKPVADVKEAIAYVIEETT